MARTKRTDRERTLEREKMVWEMRLRLWSHERIAEELTRIERDRDPSTSAIDRSTVTKMLARINKRKDAEMDHIVSVARHEHTALLENIAREALEGYYSSKQPAKDAEKSSQTGKGAIERSRVQTQNADPRFLTEARGALRDIREIWGVNAPDKTELTGKDGAAIAITREITDEELERIASMGSSAGAFGTAKSEDKSS